MRLRAFVLVSVGLNVALLAALVLSQSIASPGYEVNVRPGLVTQRTADDAAAGALERLASMADTASANGVALGPAARVLSVVAAMGDELLSIEPSSGGYEPERTVWVVRAEGTFVASRGLNPKPRVFTTGFFVIDDASGKVLVMGMP